MFPLDLVESIPGWMLPEDAEKLYELASRTDGPIVEIGTYHGKSTALMALAGRDARNSVTIYSMDVDRRALGAALAAAKSHGVDDRIAFIHGTLAAFARAYPCVKPALTFVDGDHSLAGVSRDLLVLRDIVPNGGLILFHDFHDPRHEDPSCAAICVTPAVSQSWVREECDFVGLFGCCGLFARRTGPPPSTVTIADLMKLDSLGSQLRNRLQTPLVRTLRARRKTLREFCQRPTHGRDG